MRRVLLVLAVAALMAVMMAMSVAPAFAERKVPQLPRPAIDNSQGDTACGLIPVTPADQFLLFCN